jgi:serine/threonine protein kinase
MGTNNIKVFHRKIKIPLWDELRTSEKCQLPFEGLIDGLTYLHDKLICHKDIKPEKIMFHGRTPVTIDFGIIKLYISNALTKFTNSTFDFLALEQIVHPASSPISDISVLGCCFLWLFLAATGGGCQPLDSCSS